MRGGGERIRTYGINNRKYAFLFLDGDLKALYCFCFCISFSYTIIFCSFQHDDDPPIGGTKRREWQHGEHGVALLFEGGRHSDETGGKRALGYGIPTGCYGICASTVAARSLWSPEGSGSRKQ